MASSGLNSIRVRLYFDYPPPSTPECRMCWLLVDPNKCRVVADLSSIIKEKFNYSRKTLLDLFIEDCYLPTTESVYIVRDNDSIRVKVSSSVSVNGSEAFQHCEVHNSKGKKRGREEETQICVTKGSSKKTKQDDAQIDGPAIIDHGNKKKRKKKKKERKQSANDPLTISLKDQAVHSAKRADRKSTSGDKTTRAKNQESTSSSSDSSEVESKGKPSTPKPKPKQTGSPKTPTATARKETSSSDSESSDEAPKSSTCKTNIPVTPKSSLLPATPKLSTSTKSKIPLQTPKRRSSTDSSSSSSGGQLQSSVKKSQVASQPSSSTQSSLGQSVSASGSKKPQDEAQSSDSDASEIELVIKKPNLNGMGLNIAGLRSGTSESAGRTRGNTRGPERGRGRGANRGNGRGGFGRAKGTPWKQDFQYNYENGEHQEQRDSLTNESFIIQNAPESKPTPKRDYTTLPLLAAPPLVGQKIAFKLLELTENYTPEVSEYKEGKIIALNPQTKMIELELLSKSQGPVEPGKFDLVYENPDGSERVEYAVTHGSQLTECWDSLLEPRLILENVG